MNSPSEEQLDKKSEKLKDIMEPLGFISYGNFKWFHPDIDIPIDMSGMNPEKIIYIVFQFGLNKGKSNRSEEFRKLLEFPDHICECEIPFGG